MARFETAKYHHNAGLLRTGSAAAEGQPEPVSIQSLDESQVRRNAPRKRRRERESNDTSKKLVREQAETYINVVHEGMQCMAEARYLDDRVDVETHRQVVLLQVEAKREESERERERELEGRSSSPLPAILFSQVATPHLVEYQR